MTAPLDDPDDLHALAAIAMGHAFDSLPPRGALMPFALVEGPHGRQLHRAVADRLEEMLARTREVVASAGDLTRAVVVYDGYMNLGGRRTDAIFVDAYEGGAAGGILIGQPYGTVGLLKKKRAPLGSGGIVARDRPPLF